MQFVRNVVNQMERLAVKGVLKTFFTQRRFLTRLNRVMICDRKVWLRMIKTPLREYAERVPAYVWN